jgi:hypothetical protein
MRKEPIRTGCAAPGVNRYRRPKRDSKHSERREIAYVAANRTPPALTAMVGGTLYVVAGLVQLTSPEQTGLFSRMSDCLIEALLALSLLLTLAGFVALHLLFRAGGYRGLRGWVGFRAAALGQGAMLASAAIFLTVGAPALGFLYFAGTLALLVGLALLSVATLLASVAGQVAVCPATSETFRFAPAGGPSSAAITGSPLRTPVRCERTSVGAPRPRRLSVQGRACRASPGTWP